MPLSRYLTYGLILLLLAGCATSKSFQKKGAKLEQAGLMEEAANQYLISLQKNRSNVEAKIGLKSTGQVLLNRLLTDFNQQKVFGNKKEAIEAWYTAKRYHEKVANLGVQLDVPSMYQSDYEEIKDSYLNELYDEGLELMEAGSFQEAEKRFVEIKRIDPNFEDAHELADIAYVEPIYNEAMVQFDLEHYRSAYEKFKRVTQRMSNFKDAKEKSEECIELGRFTLAILPFENSTTRSGLDIKISAYSLEALTSVSDPFLKVVDRENLELILEEQKLGLTGVMDEETAVSVGELIGAKAIVSGTILNYGENIGRAQRTRRDAYEQYKVKRLNKEDNKYYYETKYRKTSYDEYVSRNLVTASFQYKVISLKTGEILASRIIEKELKDEVMYGVYDGELRNLFPAATNGVNTNRRAKSQLNNLMAARQTPRSVDELSNDVFRALSDDMKKDVEKLMKELVE